MIELGWKRIIVSVSFCRYGNTGVENSGKATNKVPVSLILQSLFELKAL